MLLISGQSHEVDGDICESFSIKLLDKSSTHPSILVETAFINDYKQTSDGEMIFHSIPISDVKKAKG